MYGIQKFLPLSWANCLAAHAMFAQAEELRIRTGAPILFFAGGREYFTDILPTREQVAQLVRALSEHSLYSFSDELSQGFFTIGEGVRVGVAGRVVSERGMVKLVRDFSSVNIRFPREIKGMAHSVAPWLQTRGRLLNTLIISAPGQGKTTLLRDIVCAVSNGDAFAPLQCTVIDERGELSGGLRFHLGKRTDVLTGCPKAAGMTMALRALAPGVIATDEIGGPEELSALMEAVNSGVRVLATAHCDGWEELTSRLFFRELLAAGMLERVILLTDTLGRGTVERIFDGQGAVLCSIPFLLRSESYAV